MVGLLVQIRPHMGLDLLLPLFAAAILGGIGSVPGAMLGGPDRRASPKRSRCSSSAPNGAPPSPSSSWSPCCCCARRACSGGPHDVDLLGYGAFFLTMALTYAIICLGLNVQWGQTGLFNVGVAGFVAIGAYASALLTTPDDRRTASAASACRSSSAGWAALLAAALVSLPGRRAHHPAARRLSGHRHLRRRGRRPALPRSISSR